MKEKKSGKQKSLKNSGRNPEEISSSKIGKKSIKIREKSSKNQENKKSLQNPENKNQRKIREKSQKLRNRNFEFFGKKSSN